MKILVLASQPYPYMSGGTARKFAAQTKYLQKNDHEVTMIMGTKKKKERIVYMDKAFEYAKIHNVGLPYSPLGKSNFKLLYLLFYWLLVQLVYYISGFITARKYIKEIDLIEVNGVFSEGLLAITLNKIYKVPVIYVHAGSFGAKRRKTFEIMKRGKLFVKIANNLMTKLEKFVYLNCKGIYTVENVEDYYRNLGFKGTYDSLKNGVDTEIFYPKDCTKFKEQLGFKNKRIISYIGRLATVKNIPIIIEAFNKIREKEKDLVLLIIGEGMEEKNLKLKAKNSKFNSDIHFYGVQKNVASYYHISDIIAISSKYEGICLVAIEAMACGKKVICSAVGLLPTIIINNKNGYLIHGKITPEGMEITVDDMFKKMKIALDCDDDSIGVNALKTIETKLSWNTCIIKYIKVYKDMIHKKNIDNYNR